MKIREIIQTLFPTRTWELAAIIAGGVLCGLGSYALYASRAWTYLSGDPTTCVNCRIIGPYCAIWNRSSHSRNTTCNDCHVPHESAVKGWFFKGMDRMRHASVFMMQGEPRVIQAINESAEVIMNNCIRCHTQLSMEFVSTEKIDHEMAVAGERKTCWDCHHEVSHGGMNNLSPTPNALVPCPKPVPSDWLKDILSE